jgi:hypothetical protein
VFIQSTDRPEHLFVVVAARAVIEKVGERKLVLMRLVDIRGAQFGLPWECMVRALENLSLFSN